MESNVMPNGAQIFVDNTYYKIGLRRQLFRWSGTEWVSSTRSKTELKKAIFGGRA